MITSIIISLIAFFFACIGSRNKNFKGLEIAFAIITIFSCLRYNFGTDYMSYMEDFDSINKYSVDYILFDSSFKDKGWDIIQYYVYPIGWFLFVGLISIFCNVTYYKLIKRYVPPKDYWLSFFIYVFTFDMFILQQSMIRQGLAIALLVWVYILLDKPKQNVKLMFGILFIIGLAFSIHKTVAFAVPFMLLRLLPQKWSKITSIVMVGCFFALFLIKTIFAEMIADIVVLEAFSNLSYYSNENGAEIGVRAMLECIPFFISALYIYKKGANSDVTFIILTSMCATMILPFTTIVHLISRVAFYFSILYIVSIPLTYKEIKIPGLRMCLLALLMVIQLYVYVDRFNAPSYKKAFREYHTVFSAF